MPAAVRNGGQAAGRRTSRRDGGQAAGRRSGRRMDQPVDSSPHRNDSSGEEGRDGPPDAPFPRSPAGADEQEHDVADEA